MLNLFIARHGNTFDKGDEILRVGKKTDLPLSLSGQQQAKSLGKLLKELNLSKLDKVFVSNLIRTQQTAQLALETVGFKNELVINALLDEIDYGPDEGQPEKKVVERVGTRALEQWEARATVPSGWLVEPQEIIQGWRNIANQLVSEYLTDSIENNTTQTNILMVTSNGIARFSPYITGDFENFAKAHNIKMKTGALSCFQYDSNKWNVKFWNQY